MTNFVATPSTGSLAIAGGTPGLRLDWSSQPLVGTLTFSGSAPGFSVGTVSALNPTSRPRVPLTAPDPRQHMRQMAERINDMMSGHIDVTCYVTLLANVPQTVVADARVSNFTAAIPVAQTPDAAAEIAAGTMHISCITGTLTIAHSVSSVTDRTFTFALLG